MNRKGLILALAALVVVVLAAIGLSRSQIAEPLEKQRKDNQVASAETEEAPAAPAQTSQICGSNATYARLKEVAFEEAFLVLADEPTGNLDERTADIVLAQFLDLVRGEGSAALVATHNERLAAKMDRVVRLHEGVLE
jgi:ABC-type lipoprotein export system ATPase subunit